MGGGGGGEEGAAGHLAARRGSGAAGSNTGLRWKDRGEKKGRQVRGVRGVEIKVH